MHRPRVIAWLLVLATAVVLGGVCGHEFTRWDDHSTIALNPRLNPPTVANALHYWTHSHMDLYIPVTYTLWSGLAAVAQVDQPDANGIRLNPWIFHSANLLFHILSVLVVFAILRLLIGHDWPAFAGAIVFALHPVQVEPIAWTSGTKDLLSGGLSLLAVWQYLLYAKGRGRGHYALATAAFVLAILSKPAAVVTPALAAVLDLVLLGRPLRRTFTALVPWAMLAIPCVIIGLHVQPERPGGFIELWQRPLIAGYSLAFYLYQLLWPASLAPDYSKVPAQLLEQPLTYYAWLVPAAIVGALLWARSRWLWTAALIFAAGLLPVLGLVPFEFQFISTVTDHYLYLAMLGPAIAVAWGLRNGIPKTEKRNVIYFALGLVLVAMAARTFFQVPYWRDDLTLFTHTVQVTPNSFAAHNNLGIELSHRGRDAEAEQHLRTAIALRPTHPSPRKNLALMLLAQGRYEEVARDEVVMQEKDFQELLKTPAYAEAAHKLQELRAAMQGPK